MRDIIVIGGSAGCLHALTEIIGGLTPAIPAAVFVVVHTRADANGLLPRILGRRSQVPVAFATHRAVIRRGHVYVAPPDFQLLLKPGRMLVIRGPRENGFRPAVDPLFRTAGRAFGSRVVGVILSGALDDGTYGLNVVKQHGGLAVVQDPADAEIPSMPASAIRHVDVDAVIPAAEIASALERFAAAPIASGGPSVMSREKASETEPEPQLPEDQTRVHEMEERFGAASALTCPDCGGALWELQDGELTRYRCHVGHQFAPDSLAAEQRDAVEGALWSAVRVLEEHSELRMRMAKRAAAAGLALVAGSFEEGARNSHDQAQQIRALLFAGNGRADREARTPSREAAATAGRRGARRKRAAG